MAISLPLAPSAPAPSPVTHDVTIVTTRKLSQARVMGVPPEEFGIERGARSIRDCNYCFHEVVTKTESELIAEGFDAEQVKSLGDYTGNTEIETLARDTVDEHYSISSGGVNPAARLVRITEHYVRMDYEGDGRPLLYQVITGGDQGEVLRKGGKECIAPFDAIPFATATPVPVTHRFFGRSIADLVMPVQREKTALKRGALDNLYLHNNPRVEVAESMAGPNTLDDLLVSRPGGVVRTKQPGGLNWQAVPDITTSIYPMMQYLDAELESRTGVSKQTQGLDANALQNQSATAVAQVFSASQMRMKLIARILAEGVRDIFSLLHGTIRKHGQQQQTVRLRNAWVNVDPRNWKTRDDMTINVGLGAGGKALDLIDASHRGDLPGAVAAAAGMIPDANGVARGFSQAEREIMSEAKSIVTSPQMVDLAAAHGAGEPMTVNIGGRLVQYEPNLPASGMTAFGENGFLLGPNAFSSNLEHNQTVLHELHRLNFSNSAGGVSADLATQETKAAADFAARAGKHLP